MTNFFVHLVVENLLIVLKTLVFHILYFLDYCLFSRVCTFRARARNVIIDCLPYYSGSPPRRGARRKGGRRFDCAPPSLYMIMLWMPLFWCPLCRGNLSFARKGLISSVWVHVRHDWNSLVVFFEISRGFFGCFPSFFRCAFGCFTSSCKACA